MASLPPLTATDAPTENSAAQGAPAGNPYEFDLPGDAGKFSIDLAGIPAETRMELLKSAVKTAIFNRVNVANVRHNKKAEPFAAYDKYAAAVAAYEADPISNAKPEGDAPAKPEGDNPGTIDLRALAQQGADALLKGELRVKRASDGTAKSRTPKDPVDALVTQSVAKELYSKEKAKNPKYTYPMATKAVGTSGIEYLRGRIEEAVAAGGDRGQLEKMLETRYLAPARVMAGVTEMKGKNAELPNIL